MDPTIAVRFSIHTIGKIDTCGFEREEAAVLSSAPSSVPRCTFADHNRGLSRGICP